MTELISAIELAAETEGELSSLERRELASLMEDLGRSNLEVLQAFGALLRRSPGLADSGRLLSVDLGPAEKLRLEVIGSLPGHSPQSSRVVSATELPQFKRWLSSVDHSDEGFQAMVSLGEACGKEAQILYSLLYYPWIRKVILRDAFQMSSMQSGVSRSWAHLLQVQIGLELLSTFLREVRSIL